VGAAQLGQPPQAVSATRRDDASGSWSVWIIGEMALRVGGPSR